MSEATSFPRVVPLESDAKMADDNAEDRRSGHDRRESRSGFSDPKFWVSFSAVLLTIFLALFGYIASTLSQINATVQAYALMTTKNTTEIDQVKRELDQVRAEKQMLEARIIPLEKKTERLEAILTLSNQQRQ